MHIHLITVLDRGRRIRNYRLAIKIKIYIIHSMDHCYLSVSTRFLFFPILVFIYKNKNNIYETSLAFLLSINMILSFLFWTNPIEKSFIHFLDGVYAKLSFLLFMVYILFAKEIDYKTIIMSIIILCLIMILFFYSDKYSKIKWCCREHIFYHSIFHFFISAGCSIAFN